MRRAAQGVHEHLHLHLPLAQIRSQKGLQTLVWASQVVQGHLLEEVILNHFSPLFGPKTVIFVCFGCHGTRMGPKQGHLEPKNAKCKLKNGQIRMQLYKKRFWQPVCSALGA